jgi:RHS repeat-associated protein
LGGERWGERTYSKGKQTKVSDPGPPLNPLLNEDAILEYDLLQRVKKSKKKIGTDEVTFEKSYDTSGRVLSIKYLAGTPNEKGYSYEYDVAGNILYIKENAFGNHLIDYSDFTALGQQKIATFPKPNNVSVKTTSTYDPQTGRLKTLITQKLSGGVPTETYQNLDYQQFDGKGNLITLADTLNGITHSYTYDPLDRLLIANGVGTNPYSQNYEYDRIGNIIYKSDFGTYSYDYANKPHAVKSVVTDGPVFGDPLLNITYNYDNKPELIKKNGSNYVQLTYDGNGKRVKKYNYNTGQTVPYFGELYEVRGGVGIIHLFAGKQRVASVLADGRTQFYHTNHLGSASVITDGNGAKKEKMEYFPFGTYKEAVDYDSNFPDVFYTFTGQEDDDDLGFYNYVARLYDPLLGGFISPDIVDPDTKDPRSLNRYSYARNNPLRYIDPTGKQANAWEGIPSWFFNYDLSLNLINEVNVNTNRFGLDINTSVYDTVTTWFAGLGNLIPTGAGVSVSETTDIGAYFLGAGQSGSFGRLWWKGDDEVGSVKFLTWGGFLGSGSMAYPQQTDASEKNFAIGAFGGGGINLLITNMRTEADLERPFWNLFINAGWIFREASVQVSVGANGVYVLSYGGRFPFINVPTGLGFLGSLSVYYTNTWIPK